MSEMTSTTPTYILLQLYTRGLKSRLSAFNSKSDVTVLIVRHRVERASQPANRQGKSTVMQGLLWVSSTARKQSIVSNKNFRFGLI